MFLHSIDNLGGFFYVFFFACDNQAVLSGGYADAEGFAQEPKVAVCEPEQFKLPVR